MPKIKKKSPGVKSTLASYDGCFGRLYINETRQRGATGFNWNFNTPYGHEGAPYVSVTIDKPFTTVEEAIADAEDFGVEHDGRWRKPRAKAA